MDQCLNPNHESENMKIVLKFEIHFKRSFFYTFEIQDLSIYYATAHLICMNGFG